MAKLLYSMITSLDGFVADEQENSSWAAPDDEVHRHANDCRAIDRHLLQAAAAVMKYWETADAEPDQSPTMLDFASAWKAADKIVYSRVSTASRLRERELESSTPDAVRQLKAQARAFRW